MFYLKCFFIYSHIFFLFETIISKIRKNDFSSGILFLPWTPIYGLGSIIILLVSNYVFKTLFLVKWKEIIIIFLFVIFLLTILEWIGGHFLEFFFHVVFWNYENYDYHIGKYISLEISVLWGIMSIFFIYVIHPLINKYIIAIPKILVFLLCILFCIDFILSFINYNNKY